MEARTLDPWQFGGSVGLRYVWDFWGVGWGDGGMDCVVLRGALLSIDRNYCLKHKSVENSCAYQHVVADFLLMVGGES